MNVDDFCTCRGPGRKGGLVDDLPTRYVGEGVEFGAAVDAGSEMTPEYASRLAVIAVVADLEGWARTASIDGCVDVDDLTRTLALIRRAGALDA
jgi:hypothetical protein